MEKRTVLGIMSGTSLDGLDLACCEFWQDDSGWQFRIVQAETVPYDERWLVRLGELHKQPMFLLPKTDAFFGKYIGQCVNRFLNKHRLECDLIASHGHTIFHAPAEGYTTQIGSGAAIYAETNIPVVCDLRSVDVALGGQGAPLVPIGDAWLFGSYQACLNLGGFSNISYNQHETRLAYDISPCNWVLNLLANQLELPFDEGGSVAASGVCNDALLAQLNALDYYRKTGSKSLGREWVEQHVMPLLKQADMPVEDLLATFTRHIAAQVAHSLNQAEIKQVLVTGGGAYNTFLIKQIRAQTVADLVIPEDALVQFKEAIIFAFLGVLRVEGLPNALPTVTKASRPSIGGALYGFVG